MAEYLYDGTFEGFLCCVYAHYHREKAEAIHVKGSESQMGFLRQAVEIQTDEAQADVVYRAIAKKISPVELRRVYRMFLAEAPEKDMTLLNYLRFGFIKGSSVSRYHGLEIVRRAELLEHKVLRERERYWGILRFSVLQGNVLYAAIEPDHNIVELLAPHFCDRYRNEAFIIHDVRRSKAVIASGGRFYLSAFSRGELPPLHGGEADFRRLWKKYFETIAIRERTNPRCQGNFLPLRYRKYLTEMQPDKF